MSIFELINAEFLEDSFEPKPSFEEILKTEDPVFKKVEKVLERKFTLEQMNILKALLFFLKREKELEVKFKTIENDILEIFNKEGDKIGFINYNRHFEVDSRSVFSNKGHKEYYIGKGLGVLSYVKIAILLSIRTSGRRSLLSDLPNAKAKKVWLRLKKTNLAKEKYDGFVFKNISFLTEKDFEVIDEILNS